MKLSYQSGRIWSKKSVTCRLRSVLARKRRYCRPGHLGGKAGRESAAWKSVKCRSVPRSVCGAGQCANYRPSLP